MVIAPSKGNHTAIAFMGMDKMNPNEFLKSLVHIVNSTADPEDNQLNRLRPCYCFEGEVMVITPSDKRAHDRSPYPPGSLDMLR